MAHVSSGQTKTPVEQKPNHNNSNYVYEFFHLQLTLTLSISMRNHIKKTARNISILLTLTVSAMQTFAQLNIDMKNVDIYDTVYTCDNIMSINFFPDTITTQLSYWIVVTRVDNEWITEDTILFDTLSLNYPFREGTVRHNSWDGINYYSTSIEVRPLVLNTGYIPADCNSELQLHASTNYSGDDIVNYSWAPAEYLSDPHSANPTAVNTGNDFSVSLTTSTGCFISKTVNITLDPPETPSICMVSIDSLTNKNIIYWETASSSGLDSVFIYRETDITNEYERIGHLGIDNPGFFIDARSNPLIQSNKYMIAFLDSCGNISEYSEPHKTMHLAINQGQNNSWNLIWEPYQGFNVSTYRIYRGNIDGEMELIGTTSGSSTQYTDFSAPLGNVKYQIEVINPYPCNISGLKSTQAVLNTSRSNIANNLPTVLPFTKYSNSYSIYPNPFRTVLHIDLDGVTQEGIVELSGIDGKIIKRNHFKSGKIDIDGSSLKTGTYILKIKSGNEISSHIIVKE